VPQGRQPVEGAFNRSAHHPVNLLCGPAERPAGGAYDFFDRLCVSHRRCVESELRCVGVGPRTRMQQFLQCLVRIGRLKQGAFVVPADAVENRLLARREPDYKADLLHEATVLHAKHGAATGRDDAAAQVTDGGQNAGFEIAERGFSSGGEDGADVRTGTIDDELIGVQKLEPQATSEQAADAGFAAAHKPDKNNILSARYDLLGWHAGRNARRVGKAQLSNPSCFSRTPIASLQWHQTLHHIFARNMTPSPPLVGIIMGSTSDWETMRHAAEMLERLGVPAEKAVVSAHRTPDRMAEWAKSAAGRGLKVIIAGAGGAAHLPGMVAAHTHLPVLGVPVESKILRGVDSLLSIVQMPAGIPVGTLAIGVAGAKNAGLLAASIIGLNEPAISQALQSFRSNQTAEVLATELGE
jgi:5-(carboxyamino)imidazole ribonucleotide mutase